jgi:hypothetical protein
LPPLTLYGVSLEFDPAGQIAGVSNYTSWTIGTKATYALTRVPGRYELFLNGAIEYWKTDYKDFINLQTGIVIGVEALARWLHPERGLIPPGDFLPVAAETGLIVEIDALILREACREVAELRAALGAEGVQMGTRMVSAAESPVHDNWKSAIVAAAETDTVFLNQFSRPALRALRTQKTARLERELVPDYQGPPVMGEFARAKELYFGGDMEASIALSGQVAGRIDSVKPVKQIIGETVDEFFATIRALGTQYAA